MSLKLAFASLFAVVHTPVTTVTASAIRQSSTSTTMSSKRIIPIDIISDTI